MRVLVTGATGYVGRVLTRRLLEDGHEAVALARDPARARDLLPPGIAMVEGDLHAAASVVPWDVDAIVHLAFSMFPVSDGRTNVAGSLRLIDAARARNVRRFVYTSSALVYGPSDPSLPVSEDHACRPSMRFARQQLRVETALRELAETDNFPAVVLRPSEVYGGDGGFLPSMVDQLRRGQLPLAGDGHQAISFTARQDLVEAIARCLTADLRPGEVLNVNAPVPVDAARLFDDLASALGAPRPRRIPVPLVYAAGAVAGAIATTLGRRPSFDLDLARLACLRSGPRSIERARRAIGFEPTDQDPRKAIEALFLGGMLGATER